MEPQVEYEILFSGGMYAISYQTGFAKYLLELIGKEKLRKCQIGGVSSGAASSCYLYTAINQDKYDINDFYHKYVQGFFTSENPTGIFPGNLMYKKSKEFYEEFQDDPNLFKNKKYHLYISIIRGLSLKPMICDEFKDSDEFATGCVASGFIPGLTGAALYYKIKDEYGLDGGFTKCVPQKYSHTKKLFINVLPNVFPFVFDIPENCEVIHINEIFNLVFPNDYWCWNLEYSDSMYLKGYCAGEKSKQTLLRFFDIQQ